MSSITQAASDQLSHAARPLLLAAALAGISVVGAIVAIEPVAAFPIAAAALGLIAIPSPAARFAVVVVGGMVVFRTSDQVDTAKAAYLLWVAASAAVAVARLAAERDLSDLRPMLMASGALAGAIALSLVAALVSGTELVDWVRDAAPYGLLAVAPLIAWDGARSRLGPHMEAIAVAVGLMASAAFAVEWLGRRGLAELMFTRIGLGSPMLAALAFAVATAAVLSGRRPRLPWLMVPATILTMLLITGTRSSLVLLVGPVAMVLVGAGRFTRLSRLIGAVAAVVVLGVTLWLLVDRPSLVDTVRLVERLGSIFSLGSNLSADPSFIERATQISAALAAFEASPIVGVGLGFRFDWLPFAGEPVSSYNIDTGLSLAAKFGVAGIGLLAIAVATTLWFFRRLRLRLPEHVRRSAVGFGAIATAMLLFGNPMEDKGFALAFTILVAWVIASTTAESHGPGSDMRPT